MSESNTSSQARNIISAIIVIGAGGWLWYMAHSAEKESLALRVEVNGLHSKIDEMTAKNEDLTKTIGSVIKGINLTPDKVREILKTLGEEKSPQVVALAGRMDLLDAKFASLYAKLPALNSKSDELAKRVDALNSKIDAVDAVAVKKNETYRIFNQDFGGNQVISTGDGQRATVVPNDPNGRNQGWILKKY